MAATSKKILTVDDSPTVREMLKTTLQNAGFNVLQAINGEEALKLLEAESIEMLITDLNMPKLDGISLIREVRKSPGGRFLPIIMLTTESQEDKKREGKSAGASGWIVKPFKPEQLLSVVRMVLP